MNIHFLQHDPLDGPGTLLDWARERGHSITNCLICNGDPLPDLESFDLLVSLGGPMGAYEEEKHPWIAAEKSYLREAQTAGKKILGLCLGAQLLADALGGKAYRHSLKEFGWQPIMLTKEGINWLGGNGEHHSLEAHKKASFLAFQWHGDTYSIPPDAVQIARNDACEQQAFIIRSSKGDKVQIVGLQFHLEWTEKMMSDALADPDVALNMIPSPTVQTPEQIMSDRSLFESGRKRFFELMDRFAC